MRIHHFTMPANNPEHVAHVLAELTGGRPVRMPHPEGAWMVVAADSPHTLLEVWPARSRAEVGSSHVAEHDAALPERWPHHAYVSVDLDTDAIVAILEREGWAHDVAWNGAPGGPGFELVRLWVENQMVLELASPEQLAQYTEFCAAFAAAAARK
jgi:hypothetical protein